MNKVLYIKKILGSDIRVRSRISEITVYLDAHKNYTLDFQGVEFLSRSFADELVSTLESFPGKIVLDNMQQDIADMLSIVKSGRGKKYDSRHRSQVKVLSNMTEVESFFAK